MSIRRISPQTARRLAIAAQHLENRPYPMLDTIRRLGCLQIDPTKIVMQTQFLVLYSRLGPYDMAEFNRLMWEERALFEYWAHAASIVLTEHYPIHAFHMRQVIHETSPYTRGTGAWMKANDTLRQRIIDAMHERDFVAVSDLGENERPQLDWHSSGWTNGRTVERMLDCLWMRGEILVAARTPNTRLWGLAEKLLPDWTPQAELDEHEVTRQAILIALGALGVATPKHINLHFTRHRYPQMASALRQLEAEGRIQQVEIVEHGNAWKGTWYVADYALLERIEAGNWQPRMSLLSPFDNLICDRDRTEQMFDFRFRLEIYTPKEKRQYGFFVMPILDGDRLAGRIDPRLNRKEKRLEINAVHWESAPTLDQKAAMRTAVEALASWLGAETVDWPE